MVNEEVSARKGSGENSFQMPIECSAQLYDTQTGDGSELSENKQSQLKTTPSIKANKLEEFKQSIELAPQHYISTSAEDTPEKHQDQTSTKKVIRTYSRKRKENCRTLPNTNLELESMKENGNVTVEEGSVASGTMEKQHQQVNSESEENDLNDSKHKPPMRENSIVHDDQKIDAGVSLSSKENEDNSRKEEIHLSESYHNNESCTDESIDEEVELTPPNKNINNEDTISQNDKQNQPSNFLLDKVATADNGDIKYHKLPRKTSRVIDSDSEDDTTGHGQDASTTKTRPKSENDNLAESPSSKLMKGLNGVKVNEPKLRGRTLSGSSSSSSSSRSSSSSSSSSSDSNSADNSINEQQCSSNWRKHKPNGGFSSSSNDSDSDSVSPAKAHRNKIKYKGRDNVDEDNSDDSETSGTKSKVNKRKSRTRSSKPKKEEPVPDSRNLEKCSTTILTTSEIRNLPSWAHIIVGNKADKKTWMFPVRDSSGCVNKPLLVKVREQLSTGKRNGKKMEIKLTRKILDRVRTLYELAWPGLPCAKFAKSIVACDSGDEEGIDSEEDNDDHWLNGTQSLHNEAKQLLKEIGASPSKEDEEEERKRLEEEEKERRKKRQEEEARRLDLGQSLVARMRARRVAGLHGNVGCHPDSKIKIAPSRDKEFVVLTGTNWVSKSKTKSKLASNKKSKSATKVQLPEAWATSKRRSFRAKLKEEARMGLADRRAMQLGFKNAEHQMKTEHENRENEGMNGFEYEGEYIEEDEDEEMVESCQNGDESSSNNQENTDCQNSDELNQVKGFPVKPIESSSDLYDDESNDDENNDGENNDNENNDGENSDDENNDDENNDNENNDDEEREAKINDGSINTDTEPTTALRTYGRKNKLSNPATKSIKLLGCESTLNNEQEREGGNLNQEEEKITSNSKMCAESAPSSEEVDVVKGQNQSGDEDGYSSCEKNKCEDGKSEEENAEIKGVEDKNEKKDKNELYRKLLEAENLVARSKLGQKRNNLMEDEASEEEIEDGVGDYGMAVRKKANDVDLYAEKYTEEDLEGIVDSISGDEGDDGGDGQDYHREMMNQHDDKELEDLINDVENHRLAHRKRQMRGRLGRALDDDSEEESSDEEDEMARKERYKNIDEQRRLMAMGNNKKSEQGVRSTLGETLEEVDEEMIQQQQFLQKARLERNRIKMHRKLKRLNTENSENTLARSNSIIESMDEESKNILKRVRSHNNNKRKTKFLSQFKRTTTKRQKSNDASSIVKISSSFVFTATENTASADYEEGKPSDRTTLGKRVKSSKSKKHKSNLLRALTR